MWEKFKISFRHTTSHNLNPLNTFKCNSGASWTQGLCFGMKTHQSPPYTFFIANRVLEFSLLTWSCYGLSSPELELSFTLCDNHVSSASSVNNVPCLIVANRYFVTVTYICKSFHLRVNTCYILFININYKFQYFPPWTELRRIRSLYASITCAVRLLSTMCYAWL